MTREETRNIKIGNITIGGKNEVLIQSMCNIKTSKVNEVVAQINRLSDLGADLMRVSIMDEEDVEAIKTIVKLIDIPLVGDIHFDYRLAIKAIENGINKIRINPGNIGGFEKTKLVIEAAKKYGVPIRIGVNSGSLDKETLLQNDDKVTAKALVSLASSYIRFFEEQKFYDIVISLKASSVITTIQAYREISMLYSYPLHLGITEAGNSATGLIRSAAGLSPLLLDGIGDTIRISLTEEPEQEIIACKRLLTDLNLYHKFPHLISCPTCGRTAVNVKKLVDAITPYLENIKKPLTVAIMGCIVNGPGEARQADIGLAGGKNEFVLFKKGQILRKVKEEDAIKELIFEIDNCQ